MKTMNSNKRKYKFNKNKTKKKNTTNMNEMYLIKILKKKKLNKVEMCFIRAKMA